MAKKWSTEWWQTLPPERTGKETEKLIEGMFDEWNKKQGFAWHRLPDAKSARGLIPAQPADYLYFNLYRKSGGMVEAKATKHEYRLAKDKVSQLPTLKMFDMAGACNVVLVNHYMQGVWRAVKSEDLETGVPSWDLRPFPTYPTAEAALQSTGFF